ncbi:LA2681 family HEPN domain-containing protein [Rathayibacter sp. AY1E9]|uniref:LA2681 family HEPN domain-containing protein n=1 Tax=Rathayibacter sp. AY1E9 TaxID=2080556 RepID=UPI0011B06ACC|nr:LA2681 family HEPN domain-containing protein [Rathayibacter sp. AY1E9]
MDGAPQLVLRALPELNALLESCVVPQDLDARAFGDWSCSLSGLQIDAASRLGDVSQLLIGRDWADRTIAMDGVSVETSAQARFNRATATSEIYGSTIRAELENGRSPNGRPVPVALEHRVDLRRARVDLSAVANNPALPPELRSRAWCNLANSLDDHSRWVEAYEAYSESIRFDPTNGNALGNITELLRRRLEAGHGQGGHYAALYEKFRKLAQSNLGRAAQIAGRVAAQRWKELPPLTGVGHESHDGILEDPYQVWVRSYRLALSHAIEGLGSDNPRWDDATLDSVIQSSENIEYPPIFAALNVLKAEYLLARRMVFDADKSLEQNPFDQDERDTGTYVDTLDMSTYGQVSASLILAQRSALDVLDKIAVAANLHFETGLMSNKVWFKSYWFDLGSGHIRKGLPRRLEPGGSLVALAELSFDVSEDGLYAESLMLRNAGTHRLVHIQHLDAKGVTSEAQSSVDVQELIVSCIQTLQIARSAFLYLIDLIHEQQDAIQAEGPGVVALPIFLQGQWDEQ